MLCRPTIYVDCLVGSTLSTFALYARDPGSNPMSVVVLSFIFIYYK